MHQFLNAGKPILTLIALFVYTWSMGQDAHFSQFYASPLTLNPALAGTAAGSYRVTANYRDKWRSAVDNPYRTFSASGDLTFVLGDEKGNPDIAGLGFLFFSDRVDIFDLNTNQVALVGSYHKSLDQRSKKYIGAGVGIGILQKSINYENISFQDQFNAIDGFTLPTGEVLPQNNLAFGDFTLGLSYLAETSNDSKLYLGVSYAHVTRPNVSFYRSDENSNPKLIKENILDAKLTAHAGASFKTNFNLAIQPRAVFLLQGQNAELTAGSNFKYRLDDRGSRFLHLGPWLRGVKNIDGYRLESVILAVGFETNGLIIGASYDHNINDLTSDRVGLNALEVSVTYIGDYENENNFCPTF